MRKLRRIAPLALVVLLAACSEHKLGGEFEVNGQKTPVVSCRIGQDGADAWGEVANAAGFRVRIVERKLAVSANTTNTKSETFVQILPPGARQFADAKCQSKSTSSSTINGRRSGSATLTNCVGPGGSVSGKFTYGQCG